MLNIEETSTYQTGLHHLGFRPFFLLGALFAVILVALWLWIYRFQLVLPSAAQLPASSWHAHEMVFGYTLAVATGFLLTAVRNWTGVQTLHGPPLMLLALLWLLARLMPLVDHPQALMAMMVFDLGFNVLLCLAILIPIVKVRQWQHIGIWSKLVFVLLGNVLFYLGLFNLLDNGIRYGLYTGLYIFLSLILVMGRRVIPFFIEKGVGYPVTLTNRRWLDLTSLVLMLIFVIAEVFIVSPMLAAITAAALFVLHTLRLAGWYTHGIWQKPLLWVLYLGYAWIVIGFAMKAVALVIDINPMLAVHAFTYGGIGLTTLGMMARITLGHTGRDVFTPPAILLPVFLLLLAGGVVRVFLPIIWPADYAMWVFASLVLWILAFGLFIPVYAPMLIKPRIDGRYG